MKNYKFIKEESGRWYIDLPEWDGDKSELEMVCGADTMLDILSQGEDFVYVYISKDYFNGSEPLSFIRMADELDNGAYYMISDLKGVYYGMEIWLCDVTKFVLGEFPNKIYIK